MSKEIYISSTPHETRLAIVENDALAEIYYERENEYTLAGSIYNGKVTRVLPGMQSSFVDIGLERDAFLYITDFMEEAGDSADFEGTASASESRPSRNGADRNGRDRGDRERNGRDSQSRLPAAEPSDADLFAQAVSSLDPARPAEGERTARGGARRGGRNRRDRNLNSDGTPRRDRSDAPRQNFNRADAPLQETPYREPVQEPTPQFIAPAEELGEAAPGADGSRRWRGRRGRRGNRGREEATPTPQTAEPAASDHEISFEEPVYEMGANAAADVSPASSEVRPERPAREDRGNREDRGERGDRNRSRGDNRGDRSPQQPPRVPRGFAPSLSLYQVDAAEEILPEVPYGREPEAPERPAEPLILPGESLSKYGAGSSEAAPPATQPVANTAPDFVLPGAWDGGFVLPGETLRPRTSAPADQSSSRGREPRRKNDRGGLESRDNRGGRGDRGPRRDRDYSTTPPHHEPKTDVFTQLEPAMSQPETLIHSEVDQPIHSTFVPPPPMPVEAAPEPPHNAPVTFAADREDAAAKPAAASEMPVEFEPTDASASFRVDPTPLREYRQAAPVLEPETPVTEIVEEEFVEPEEPVLADVSSLAAPEAAVDLAPTSESEPKAVTQPFLRALPAGLHTLSALHREEEIAAPEYTSIHDLGEMHSEPLLISEPAKLDPAAPIAIETAVVDPEQSNPVAPMYFAPGDGHLEEEELVDDEDTLPSLQASAYHEQESFRDQETLEGAADLGTMLREMSIDNITRTEPASLDDEEDDDLGEDFLEEDQLEDDEDALDSSYSEGDSPEELDSHESPGAGEGELDQFGESIVPVSSQTSSSETGVEAREPRREGGRNDRGRRDGRRGDRSRRDGRDGRDRGSSSSGGFSSPGEHDRPRDSRDSHDSRGRNSRQSMQSTNLPAISDLLKPGQEILCQIAKEPIAKKGARITSHIALPGRFLVFMPTVHHTGVSRKIESDSERRRLKEILISERGEASGGFIVRTAAAGASEEELRSDLRFLLNLWADIKTRSESSKSPALIYHDLNLIERVLRDQVTDNFSAIWVDTETEYERVLRFLQRFQPSLIRRVKLYTKETPLFEQFGITEEINKALRSKVWLKSGGSIVINQTEALVAIDINTGKFVGKTARLEDTIVKTNLDAIPEIVRQIRLRDLGGIIIIDFIDMDERKNRNKVMAALEEELKSDRAPSKVLQFNDFGLVAITRKRVKQSLERTLSTTCGVCQGTGMTKSPVSVCNDIYIEMRKMHKHLDRGDVMLRVHPEVVKQLKSSTKWLQEMEEMVGKTILVKSDPSLHPEQFDIH